MRKLAKNRLNAIGGRCKNTFRKAAAAALIAISTFMPLKSSLAEEAVDAPEPVCTRAEEERTSGWMVFRPGYVAHSNQFMIKVEGGMSAPTGTSMYGFAEIRPSETDSASLDSFYSEMRVMQRLYRGLRLYAELDIGSGFTPTLRPGLIYVISVGGWNIMPRIAPWSFGGIQDVQFSIYINRTFGNRIFTEVLTDVNFIQGTIFSEVGTDILLPRGFSAGLLVQIFSDLREGETSVSPILRASASF